MEDLFELFTQQQLPRRRPPQRRSSESSMAGGALKEAMGGGISSDKEFLDLDHAIASRSAKQSETEMLEYEPGSLEVEDEEAPKEEADE